MGNEKSPIIYLSKEEINSFSSKEEMTVLGHSYEWEGERVIHLRVSPVLHNYGLHGNAIFSKSEFNTFAESELNDVSYFVNISNDSVQVF